jgi:hypothetical protein
MTGTISAHQQSAQELLDRMLDYPGASRILADTRRRFKQPAGHPSAFDDDYVAAIGQMFGTAPAGWPMEQVAAFAAVHMKICAGEIAQVLIGASGLDGGPLSDSHRDGNTAKLTHLPSPFQVAVDLHQQAADQDGTLKWDAPIKMDSASGLVLLDACRNGVKHPVPIVATVAAGWAPLEIGSTMASRTLLHLLQEGAVARWPYGSDCIRLLVRHRGPVGVSLPPGCRPIPCVPPLEPVDLGVYELVPLFDLAERTPDV